MKTPRVAVGALVGRRLEGRVQALLIRRGPDAINGAGEWALPGGKLDALETLVQGGARELLEETDVEVARAALTGIVTEDAHWGADLHFVTHYIHVAEWRGEPRLVEPHKHSEIRWFDVETLERAAERPDAELPLFAPTRDLIRQGGLRSLSPSN